MKRIRTFLSLFLILCLALNPVPAKAADSNEVTSATTSDVGVSMDVPSTFSVLIPKKIILNGGTGEAVYQIGVKGDIDGNEVIKVIPPASVEMVNPNKTNITASVYQSKTEWAFGDITNDAYAYAGGKVTASDVSAGTYEGTLSFTISLEDGAGNVVDPGTVDENGVVLEPGIYDRYDVQLASWNECGIDLSIDYSYSSSDSNYYETTATSGYYVLNNDSRFATAKKVVIPGSVTKVGNRAFIGCTSLLSVVMQSGGRNNW